MTDSRALTVRPDDLFFLIDADGCVYGDLYHLFMVLCQYDEIYRKFFKAYQQFLKFYRSEDLYSANDAMTGRHKFLMLFRGLLIESANIPRDECMRRISVIENALVGRKPEEKLTVAEFKKVNALKYAFVKNLDAIDPALMNIILEVANLRLIAWLGDYVIAQQFKRARSIIFSNRIHWHNDEVNKRGNGTRSFFIDHPVLCGYFNKYLTDRGYEPIFAVDEVLPPDWLAKQPGRGSSNHPYGQTYANCKKTLKGAVGIKHVDLQMDNTKYSNLYGINHYVDWQYLGLDAKGARIVCVDDKKAIHDALNAAMTNNPECFTHYFQHEFYRFDGYSLEQMFTFTGTAASGDKDFHTTLTNMWSRCTKFIPNIGKDMDVVASLDLGKQKLFAIKGFKRLDNADAKQSKELSGVADLQARLSSAPKATLYGVANGHSNHAGTPIGQMRAGVEEQQIVTARA